MNNRIVKHILLIPLVLIVLTAVCALSTSAAETSEKVEIAQTAAASGTTGSCTWSYDSSTGKLTISGTGAMADYEDFTQRPWHSFRSEIKSVEIRSGVTNVGDNAFFSCRYLTSITLSETVKTIGLQAFSYCSAVSSVTLPTGLQKIADYAFYQNGLTSVTIPSKVETIGLGVFSGCASLRAINVNSSNNSFVSSGGNLYSKDMKTLYQYLISKTDTSFTIPSTVTELKGYSFYGAKNLSYVYFPSSFSDTVIHSHTFTDCTALKSITIPKPVECINVAAFKGCTSLASVTFPDTLNHFHSEAFSNCTALTSLTFPKSLSSIPADNFTGCSSLRSVKFGCSETMWKNSLKSYVKDTVILSASLSFTPDTKKPTVAINDVSNNVATSQDLVIEARDDEDLAGMYWGTNSQYSKNTYLDVKGSIPISYTSSRRTSAAGRVIEQDYKTSVTDSGTYYLTAKDAAGNISDTVSVTFYKTTLNANGSSVSPSSVITKSGNSFSLPVPTTRSGYFYEGWSTSRTATTGVKTLKPTGNATYYAVWDDYQNPTVSLSSTNNLSSYQTVTIKLSDNDSISGYYWGTSSSYRSNSFYSASIGTTSKVVSGKGTYYCVALDKAGNVSSAASITFYETKLNGNGGSTSTSTVLTKSGNSFTPSNPTRTNYSFNGWSTSSSASSGSWTITASANRSYYATWRTTLLSTPVLSSATLLTNGVNVSWQRVSGAVRYRVFRKTGSGGWKKLADTSALSYADRSTASGTKYTYTVRCINSAGTAYTSNYNGTGKSITYIAAPKLSKAACGQNGVDLAWTKIAGAVKYRVFRKTASSGWRKVKDTTAVTFTDQSAASGYKYTYTVRCINSAGTAFTSAYDTVGKSVTFVAAPRITSISRSSKGAIIKWSSVKGAAKYRVFRQEYGSSKWAKIGDTTGYTLTDSKLVRGHKYRFAIRCMNASGTYISAYLPTKYVTY